VVWCSLKLQRWEESQLGFPPPEQGVVVEKTRKRTKEKHEDKMFLLSIVNNVSLPFNYMYA